jgi:protein-S-isoprenylcysteine O-methyltransferase Ste14
VEAVMTLVPATEIGAWNAWIFMLYNFLPMPLLTLVHRGMAREAARPQSGIERTLFPVMWMIWLAAVAYSIFLPLRVGTTWFYVGLPIALVGCVGFAAVTITFATTQVEEEPLASGLYRYSRHPMYVIQLVMFLGVGIACASWVFILFTIVYSGLSLAYAATEEQHCLEKYGDAYREYIERTPRWIGVPRAR